MNRPHISFVLLLGLLSAAVAEDTIVLPGKNYVVNGGFERGEQGWSHFVHRQGRVDTEICFSGEASFRMTGVDADRHFYFWQYNLPLETGKVYTVSARLRSDALDSAALERGVLFVTNYGWTEAVALRPPTATCDWTRVSETFTAFPTAPRPDGRPTYNLVVYWAPGTTGTLWVDEVQIEEGDTLTPFADLDLKPGMEARNALQTLDARLDQTAAALHAFRETEAHAGLASQLAGVRTAAADMRRQLSTYAELSSEVREALPSRAGDAAGQLARIRTLVWTGPAHIPLREVDLPADIPEQFELTFTCLRGEHRDIALNVANLTGSGFPLRLGVADLVNDELAHAVPGDTWLEAYTVPLIRGAASPNEQFTDALPRLNDAGIAEIRATGITQVLLSVNTETLYTGRYESSLVLESTLDKATRREIAVTVTVLPRQLPALNDLDITDCYGYVGYAWPAMVALGVNTFSISPSMTDVAFADDGHVARFEPERLQRMVHRVCETVPDARFLLLNVQGMLRTVMRRCGWGEDDPRVAFAVCEWLRRVAGCLKDAGVSADRLIVETWDEPGPGDRPTARRMAEWVKQAAPEARTQFYVTGIENDEDWAATARAHDIVAPIVAACTPDNMRFLKTIGTDIWLYDCQGYGETFHPLAYCRLMPWTCRAYGLAGWGRFHWFNTSHGRGYRAWDGVEAQNLVYPSRDGHGWVSSRRYLATRAGHEDYAVLRALEQDSGEEASGFIADACRRALAMAPRRKGYHTSIVADADPGLLDNLRRQAVQRLSAHIPAAVDLSVALNTRDGKTALALSAPEDGLLRVRWLIDGELPWYELTREIAAADTEIHLADRGEVTRCLVDLAEATGRILTGTPLPIPRIRVDSTSESYGSRVLNDGIRAVSSKFEPDSAWVSSAEPVEHWVEMDLSRERTVSEVTLYWMTFTGLPRRTRVEALGADGSWQPVSATPDWRPAPGPVDRVAFTPLRTRCLRVVMAPLGGGVGGPALMGLSEVEVR
jgi:hypothetical protein